MRFFLLLCWFGSVAFAQVALAQNAPKTWDFADPKAPPLVSAYTAPGGVTASVEIKPINGALQMTNLAGGSFGVKFEVARFDAEQFSTLSFDYTRSNDTKINFFFKVNGAFYGAIFSGPPRVRPGSFLLGTVPNVGNKGHVVIPLRDWLRRFVPQAEKLSVEEMLVGNWDNEGYLMAGIGGNGPGATWSLKNFVISPVSDSPNSAPRAGTPVFEGNRLFWPLDVAAGLDTRTLVLRLDDRVFTLTSPFLRYETGYDNQNNLSRRLILEAGDAGITLRDGQIVQFSLENARDSRGRTLENVSATLPFSLSSHSASAPLPRLSIEGLNPPSLDFETDFGGWSSKSAVLSRESPAFSGVSALKLTNPRTASAFDVSLVGAVDAAQFPVLTFAYRADDRLRVDLRLKWDEKDYSIRFFDRDNPQPRLGTIEGLAADGKWHLAQIPLLDWMKKARPDATSFAIENLSFGDENWLGNARGVSWFLDDFRLAPQISGLHADVTLRDVSGLSAVSYALDQKSDTIPDTIPEVGGAHIELLLSGRAPGLHWLHVRARSGAGGWSDTAHFPFFVGGQ